MTVEPSDYRDGSTLIAQLDRTAPPALFLPQGPRPAESVPTGPAPRAALRGRWLEVRRGPSWRVIYGFLWLAAFVGVRAAMAAHPGVGLVLLAEGLVAVAVCVGGWALWHVARDRRRITRRTREIAAAATGWPTSGAGRPPWLTDDLLAGLGTTYPPAAPPRPDAP